MLFRPSPKTPQQKSLTCKTILTGSNKMDTNKYHVELFQSKFALRNKIGCSPRKGISIGLIRGWAGCNLKKKRQHMDNGVLIEAVEHVRQKDYPLAEASSSILALV